MSAARPTRLAETRRYALPREASCSIMSGPLKRHQVTPIRDFRHGCTLPTKFTVSIRGPLSGAWRPEWGLPDHRGPGTATRLADPTAPRLQQEVLTRVFLTNRPKSCRKNPQLELRPPGSRAGALRFSCLPFEWSDTQTANAARSAAECSEGLSCKSPVGSRIISPTPDKRVPTPVFSDVSPDHSVVFRASPLFGAGSGAREDPHFPRLTRVRLENVALKSSTPTTEIKPPCHFDDKRTWSLNQEVADVSRRRCPNRRRACSHRPDERIYSSAFSHGGGMGGHAPAMRALRPQLPWPARPGHDTSKKKKKKKKKTKQNF